jgi:UDP-N-acetyl-2-amino-2-deoxyglucuronate dehydrogenase
MTARAAADTVGIGFLGAGFIADYHLGGLAAAGGAAVRVIAAPSRERADAVARRFGIPEVANDWRAVLDRRDVDAVVIATPDDTHCEIACAAAAAGKAVLLQKPMGRSSEECLRILAATRRSGVFLQVSFMHRHFEEVQRTAELLAGGAAGPVLSARMRNATPGPDWNAWFFSRAKVGGGVVLQLGVHGMDLLRFLLGDVTTVSATVAQLVAERRLRDGTVVRPDNDDHAFATYRFASGALVSHEMDLAEQAGTDRFAAEIFCADATIRLRSERGPLALFAPGITGKREWVVPELPARRFGERHHADFLDRVRGRLPHDRTAIDGLATLLLAEAIYRSAAAGRTERVVPVNEAMETT